MRKYVFVAMLGGAACLSTAQVQVSTTLETYFMTRPRVAGFSHRVTWAESVVRFNPNLKATISMMEFPGSDSLDEAYVAGESDKGLLRAGRMRVAFGLSDWSEIFYNGFNHGPILSANKLTPTLSLRRQDTGVEATIEGSGIETQVALLDTKSDRYQWAPKEFRHASIRVQKSLNSALIGLDVLKDVHTTNDVYGLDLRWTAPRVVVKGEYMEGVGGKTARGYTLDVAYRVPGFPGSQLVGRTEKFDPSSKGHYNLHTLGIRQVLDRRLTVNLNYGWDQKSNLAFVPFGGVTGWTVQTMFQLRF